VIALISGTVTAAARSLGHYIALGITGALMLFVGGMLLRSAISGQRSWKYGPDSPNPSWGKRYGPFLLQQFAACLIIVDPLSHCCFDLGLWAGCSNNPTFPRINSTNAFPDNCYHSSYEYRCSVPCCVPTWQLNTGNAPAGEYTWYPPTNTKFMPNLATLRPNGTIYLPPGFDNKTFPYDVFKPNTFLWETLQPNVKGKMTDADCPHKVNPETGYCFLVDEALPYAEKMKLLPLRDASKPFDEKTNPYECNCNQCVPNENISHLSPLGIVFTIIFTYLGFALLAVAVGWNANIVDKLKGMRTKWRALRGHA